MQEQFHKKDPRKKPNNPCWLICPPTKITNLNIRLLDSKNLKECSLVGANRTMAS